MKKFFSVPPLHQYALVLIKRQFRGALIVFLFLGLAYFCLFIGASRGQADTLHDDAGDTATADAQHFADTQTAAAQQTAQQLTDWAQQTAQQQTDWAQQTAQQLTDWAQQTAAAQTLAAMPTHTPTDTPTVPTHTPTRTPTHTLTPTSTVTEVPTSTTVPGGPSSTPRPTRIPPTYPSRTATPTATPTASAPGATSTSTQEVIAPSATASLTPTSNGAFLPLSEIGTGPNPKLNANGMPYLLVLAALVIGGGAFFAFKYQGRTEVYDPSSGVGGAAAALSINPAMVGAFGFSAWLAGQSPSLSFGEKVFLSKVTNGFRSAIDLVGGGSDLKNITETGTQESLQLAVSSPTLTSAIRGTGFLEEH
jgi:hypothetical protein